MEPGKWKQGFLMKMAVMDLELQQYKYVREFREVYLFPVNRPLCELCQ